jgi:uncharacterized membrane protein YjdF
VVNSVIRSKKRTRLIIKGNNEQEDVIAMIKKYPLMNEYWEDKRAKAHLIQVPAYILASMSTGLHTVGSIRCYEDIPHEKKWLVGDWLISCSASFNLIQWILMHSF